MRGLHLLLACACVAPAAAQQMDTTAAPALQVTLDEAIRRALDVQPAMVQAEGARRNAGADSRSAYAAFLPRVTTSASSSRGNTGRIDLTSGRPVSQKSYSASLSADLDLFEGFRRVSNLRAASATSDAAAAGVVYQQFQVVMLTKQAFYDALARDELVRVAEAQVRRARQQLDVSVQKLHAGSATRSDSLRSVVDFGNARLQLLQAQADLAAAQANLGRQIGVEAPARAIPDSSLPALPDTALLREEVMRSAPQVTQAEAEARAARANVWSARSQYIPTLNLSYNGNRQDSVFATALVNNPTHTWRFTLSWTLFDRFLREQSQVSAQVQRDIKEATAADTRRQVRSQFTQQVAALGTAFLKITITTDNVAAATEDLRVQQERYRVGAGTILDLLTSQASLTQAQTDLVQARFDYLIARAQLEALVGRSL